MHRSRLSTRGAVEVSRWLDGRVLGAPGGCQLCIIPRHSDAEVFGRLSRAWE